MRIQFFIGSCDKSDLLIPASLLMQQLNRRILIVDAMSSPWLHYRNGAWRRHQKWSRWCGIDTAAAVQNWEELEQLAEQEGISLDDYDDIWVDTDRVTFCEVERFKNADARFLVQSVDNGSIYRNLEWLNTFYLLHDSRLEGLLQFILLQSISEDQDRTYVDQILMTGGFSSREQTFVLPYDERNWNARLWNETHDFKYLHHYSKSMRVLWRRVMEPATGELSDKEWRQLIKMSTKGHWLDEAM